MQRDAKRESWAGKEADTGMEAVGVRGIRHVLHLGIVMERVLCFVDKRDVDSLLEALHDQRDFRWCLVDRALWKALALLHFGGLRSLRCSAQPKASSCHQSPSSAMLRTENDSDKLPHKTAHDAWLCKPLFACDSAHAFGLSLQEWSRFHACVHVVHGDTRLMREVDGVSIDAISFATGFYSAYPSRMSLAPSSRRGRNVARDFAVMYEHVLQSAQRKKAQCLAMSVIAQAPLEASARVVMRLIRQFLWQHPRWRPRIAIVCDRPDVFDAFDRHLQRVLMAFHADEV